MTIDMASLLNVSNQGLYNRAITNTTATSRTDFTSALLQALQGNRASNRENPLYTALTSSTQPELYGLSPTSYMDNLPNNMGSAGMTEDYLSNFTDARTSNEQLGNTLMQSFQNQMLNTLTAAKANLQKNAESYAEKMGDAPSDAATMRLKQMQQNVSMMDQFIAQKQTQNPLLDQLNQNSSLTQYLISRNNSSLF